MPSAADLYYFAHEADKLTRIPVILIHGAGGTHLSWPPQVRRLNSQRIYAIDLPGHGRSPGPGRQLISEYAGDLSSFMDAIKLPAAVLVGHSMGSAVALTLTLTEPARVLGLGLLGASGRLRVVPALLQIAADPSTFRAAVDAVTENSYGAQASPRLKELAANRMAETRPSVFYGDFLACDRFDITRELVHIHAPTLILATEQDKMTPLRYARLMQQQIPGAQLKVIPAAGHMMMLEQPDFVASALAEFLNRIPYTPDV